MGWQDGFVFNLTEEEQLTHEMVRQFSQNSVEPLADKIDKEHYYPKELVAQMGELGLMGVYVPEEYGGSGLTNLAYCLIIEELSVGCASTGVICSAHNSLGLTPILDNGTQEQKEKYLKDLATGKKVGCFGLSEPGAGSDAKNLKVTVKKDGNKYIINGTKNWITNGPVADTIVLFANQEPEKGYKGITAFVLPLDLEGIERGKKEDKLGICGSPTCSISFDNVVLGAEHRLGEECAGFKIAMNTLNGGRMGIAAQAVGIARAALKAALRYSKERKAFGKVIGEHQSIQNYLADMIAGIDAARYLTLAAATLKDQGKPYVRQAAMAKLYSSEVAMNCGIKGVQIHGGYGFVKEYSAERHMRDAKITEIYEGTSEIQRLVIAGSLLKEDE